MGAITLYIFRMNNSPHFGTLARGSRWEPPLTIHASFLSGSEAPQHLDGVDQPHVRVVEVVESAEGEDAERPDEGLGDVGDDGAAAEQAGPDVVDHDGLDA